MTRDKKWLESYNQKRRIKRREDIILKITSFCDVCGKGGKNFLLTAENVYDMHPKKIQTLSCACLDCILEEKILEKRE